MAISQLKVLANNTLDSLKDSGASDFYMREFTKVSNSFIRYAEKNGIESFNMDVGLQFLDEHYSMTDKMEAGKFNKMYLRSITAMSEYLTSGRVNSYLALDKRNYVFPEPFKESAETYLDYKKTIGSSKRTIQSSSLYLERFFIYLTQQGVKSLEGIDLRMIFSFMGSLSCFEKTTINHTMRTVRYYLKFCYETGLMTEEFFSKLPNPYYNRQSRLPSVYSAEEVRTLLNSIDQGNPCGVRDYAIILLIARLGLRSSDVADLKFSNIDWDNEIIRITQKKTGRFLELPLLEDVGESIIHYLQSGRPATDSDHVFVRHKPPYTEFKSGCVGALVRSHLQRSGIRVEGRKCGSHILRHSLASRLLEHNVPLPVISGILGHATTETTMAYLRIDIDELRKCALEVIS